jgi:hypothetical protein
MGTFGLHDGLNPSLPGATVDIVPRNIELCLDTSLANELNECDPSAAQRIPIYAPTDGCAIYQDIEDDPQTPTVNENQPPTISIRIDHTDDCEANVSNDDRFVVLSHVVEPEVPDNTRVLVSAGELLGYMCLSSEAFSQNCEVNTATTPTHLAFQTQYWSGGPQQASDDILGYVAIPRCVYDDWKSDPGNPQHQPAQDQVDACPSS